MKNYFNCLFFIGVCMFLNATPLQAQKKIAVKKVVKAVAKPVPAAVAVLTFENGIKMNCKGLKVKEAALYFDDNSKVPQDNKVDVNQRVNMQVVIDTGWAIVDGKVYPGGSEVIKLSTGSTILKSDDLFAAYSDTGVNAEDAKYISIKAVITSIDDKKNHIIVSFKIWDKKGSGEITGNYKFFIK